MVQGLNPCRIIGAHTASLGLGDERLHDLLVDLTEDIQRSELGHRNPRDIRTASSGPMPPLRMKGTSNL